MYRAGTNENSLACSGLISLQMGLLCERWTVFLLSLSSGLLGMSIGRVARL